MYRIKSTGEIKSQGEVRKCFPTPLYPVCGMKLSVTT
jgi:hypothetical protein